MDADKPMQGHGLMQASARVNRVFKDKPGGWIVDYLGLADQFKRAPATSTESGGQGNPTCDTKQAIAVMLEKHGIACDRMHGFRVGQVDDRHADRAPATHPRRTGARPRSGRRQEALGAGGVGIERQRRATCQPRAEPRLLRGQRPG